MFKKTRTKVVALSVAGVLVLAAAVYVTATLTTGSASAAPATNVAATTQPAGTQAQLRVAVLDMIKDRMGLTGPQAEAFADQMIARMQQAFPNLDLKAMIDQCSRFFDSGTPGSATPRRGMMSWGRGMMSWGTDQPGTQPAGTQPGNQPNSQPGTSSMPCFR